MKSKHRWIKQLVLFVPLAIGSTGSAALPEMPFCPLGGPTGWLNRLTDDDHRYYPPPYYPPPVIVPYWNQAYPYGYVPQYPVYPGPADP